VAEIDLILAGPAGKAPEVVARANADAMRALGNVGAIPPRKKKTKRA